MKQWRWSLLIFELCLFALILVLPEVDLPDFTFHGDTAPVVAKAKLSSPPVMCSVTTAAQFRSPQHVLEIRIQPVRPAVRLTPNTLLSLLCTFVC
jgi:hypothetical protein